VATISIFVTGFTADALILINNSFGCRIGSGIKSTVRLLISPILWNLTARIKDAIEKKTTVYGKSPWSTIIIISYQKIFD